MKKRRIGIFAKTFFYTIFLIIVIIVITLAVFSKQVIEFYHVSKHQRVREIFASFQEEVDGKSYDDVKIIAERFHMENPSFEFALYDHHGTLLYTTPECEGILDPDTDGWKINDNPNLDMSVSNFNPADKELGLLAFYPEFGPVYLDFFKMSASVLASVLFFSSIGATIFAKLITDPIKKLAGDARKMSLLETVQPPVVRHDEMGQLTGDVHSMYKKLKTTISDLESEIEYRAQVEEGQRYFFSAASHELKTPIAAANALLEGMLEDIGDYRDHPKYIVECLKLMNAQTKLVNEILDIVKLSDCEIKPQYERINLNEVIYLLLSPFRTLAEQKSQKLMINISHAIYCTVDKNMFERAFCNILINSIQNSKAGESVEVWCEERGNSIFLHVLNTGVHIEIKTMDKLFEPFYRMDHARSRRDGHSGLGLTIVKKLLDRMETPFTLCNTERGVLFCVELAKATEA